jgi:hypothetical protein
MDQIFDLYIDTRNTKNTSKFVVDLPDNFIQDHIKTDVNKYDWFMTIDKCSIMNSLSSISTNVNDDISIFDEPEAQGGGFLGFFDYVNTEEETMDFIGDIHSSYDLSQFTLKPGNPNVDELARFFNEKVSGFDLFLEFNEEDSKYTLNVLEVSLRKRYIWFGNSSSLFGFSKYKVYLIDGSIASHTSEHNINLFNDNLINLELSRTSDFELINKSYSNFNRKKLQHSEIFFQMLLNVNVYETFLYQRTVENLIPIRLKKHQIKQFEILITNQDRQLVSDDGGALGASQIQLKIIKRPIKIDHNASILEYVKLIYLWIASYFKNKI